MSDIKQVGILGCGLMGSGIAQVAATAGYDTIVRDVSQQIWERARGGIEKSLAKFVEKGKLPAANGKAPPKRPTSPTAPANWKGCARAVAATPEAPAPKNGWRRAWTALCPARTT